MIKVNDLGIGGTGKIKNISRAIKGGLQNNGRREPRTAQHF